MSHSVRSRSDRFMCSLCTCYLLPDLASDLGGNREWAHVCVPPSPYLCLRGLGGEVFVPGCAELISPPNRWQWKM